MAKDAAMPAGVTVAGLGVRALVSILDVVPLALLSLLVSLLGAQSLPPTVILVVGVAATVLSLGWLVFLWWAYATRGQGLPAKWLRIRVLRLADGRRIHLLGEGHMVNLAGPRPLGNSIESMDLGFSLQARCLEAVARGSVGAESCVVPVPRAIDEMVARSYVELARTTPTA